MPRLALRLEHRARLEQGRNSPQRGYELPAAFLNLPVTDDGETNVSLTSGTISFWFQPNYTSVPDGGDGPTNWASLLTIGQWTSNASASCWSLAIDPDGTNLIFLAQSNGASQIVLTAPIDFDAGDWHGIILTYSPTNCCLYLEGQPVTNAGPIAYTPSDSDCADYGIIRRKHGGTNGECPGPGAIPRIGDLRYPAFRR